VMRGKSFLCRKIQMSCLFTTLMCQAEAASSTLVQMIQTYLVKNDLNNLCFKENGVSLKLFA
jgi:hypothetical protein